MPDRVRVERALVSVSDRTGLSEFCGHLHAMGVEMISTGGTASAIRDAGFPVVEISDVTGVPEMMGGRVKTLHPAVHGGLLADCSDAEHRAAMERHGIPRIDLVAVTLYPFAANRVGDSGFADPIAAIDIGGPAMMRAAAKNCERVLVLSDTGQYSEAVDELRANDGCTTLRFRRRCAARAFATTAALDVAVANRTWSQWAEGPPPRLLLSGEFRTKLRYGENPHQTAEMFAVEGAGDPGAFEQLQGGPLSYNNLCDIDAAVSAVDEFAGESEVGCVIVKHGSPCAAALGETSREAFEGAWAGDPESAYGGIVGFSGEVGDETASALASKFVEIVVAPGYAEGARRELSARRNLRVVRSVPTSAGSRQFRMIRGGVLVQDSDRARADLARFRAASDRHPTATERASLWFAWRVVAHARSNAVVIARGSRTVGIGAGQTSRVEAVRQAVARAGGNEGAPTTGDLVMASDGFFPFRDSVELAGEAGVRAVVHPGGSKRDQEAIDVANAAGMAMVITGRRHFRH